MTTLTHKPADPLDTMCTELRDYCAANGLPYTDAEELGMSAHVTDAQREWLVDFCLRWDAAEREREAGIDALANAPDRGPAFVPGDQMDDMLSPAERACFVVALTPNIAAYLAEHDPKALAQVRAAIGLA
jgi:hypothetical protein